MQCRRCKATWSGEPSEKCWWCAAELNALEDAYLELVTPPTATDFDNDPAVEAEWVAWCDRLLAGMRADLITHDGAHAIWRHACRQARAVNDGR